MEEQLLFDFMSERVVGVDCLEYVGGQDEHLGGYCEALVVRYEKGPDDFVLHYMYQTDYGRIEDNHLKMRFHSIEALVRGWDNMYFLCKTRENWDETDSTCGYDISPEEFYKRWKRKAV